jgi:NAD-dependent deacetylase sirtuin 5
MEDPLEPLARFVSQSTYILAFVGAGLSASPGIPTFRGISRWRGHSHEDLASVAGFQCDPLTVWQYHDSFRRTASRARPNAGHFALAKLSDAKPYFLTITQNIDGETMSFTLRSHLHLTKAV